MKSFFKLTLGAARTALLLAALFPAAVLTAQFQDPIRSIRLHGEMAVQGRSLNLAQITKSQDKIRASITAPNGVSKITIYFANDKIVSERNPANTQVVREIKGTDAAAHLLDLLALNPEFHFDPKDGFDLQHPLLEAYSVRIRRDQGVNTTGENPLVREIQLIDPSGEGDPVIRTIRYEDYFPADEYGQAPRTITFTDNTTGEGGTIHLKAYTYNVGLPDFLFEAPAVTESKP